MAASASRASSEDFEAVLTQNMNARAVPVACWDMCAARGGARRYRFNEASVLLAQCHSERLELGGAD